MNLFYRTTEGWGSNEEVDYIFTKHLTLPVRSDVLFVRVVQQGLILSPTIKGLRTLPQEKLPSFGLLKFLLEDLFNIQKPYLLVFSKIKNVNFDQGHGLLEFILEDESLKYRITQSSPVPFQEASNQLHKTLSTNNVVVNLKKFKVYEKWNKGFLIFVATTVVIILLILVLSNN